MAFDKWFAKQNLLIKIILLIIPVVNWVVELLVRWSAFLRKSSGVHLVMALVATIFGVFYLLEIIDIVWTLLKGQLFLVD